MSDEDLIGYVLDLLEPAERRAVEYSLAADSSAARRVDQLRISFAPLALDREPPLPRPGLALRTLAHLAEDLVAHEPRIVSSSASALPNQQTVPDLFLAEPLNLAELIQPAIVARQSPRLVGGWFRADLIVAAGIGLVTAALILSGISRSRHEYGVMACKNNLRALYQGLVGYSDRHEGKFPQVGDDAHPTAGTFTTALVESRELPSNFQLHCPGSPRTPAGIPVSDGPETASTDVQYAYALGYRGPGGELMGVSRFDVTKEENDLLPIAADYPAASVAPGPGPVSPHRNGHNVLYVGGNVRYATTATVGVGGDDIYRNQEGKVAAGLNRDDAALGRPGDRP